MRELERKRDAGIAGKAGRVRTVQEMLTRHLAVVLPQRGRAPLTIRSYESLCREHIYPLWGGQKIDRLLPEHIEDGYAAMLGDGLSAGSVRKIHAILSSAYEIEVKRGNVARNPCRLVEAPQLGQARKTALSARQARAVLTAAASGGTPRGGRSGWRADCGRVRRWVCGGRSPTWAPARCTSGGRCSGSRGATAARTSRSALRAGTGGVPAPLPEGGTQVRAPPCVRPG